MAETEVKLTDTPVEGFKDWIHTPSGDLMVSLFAATMKVEIGDLEKRKEMVQSMMTSSFIAGAVWDQKYNMTKQRAMIQGLIDDLPSELSDVLKKALAEDDKPEPAAENICPDGFSLDT